MSLQVLKTLQVIQSQLLLICLFQQTTMIDIDIHYQAAPFLSFWYPGNTVIYSAPLDTLERYKIRVLEWLVDQIIRVFQQKHML